MHSYLAASSVQDPFCYPKPLVFAVDPHEPLSNQFLALQSETLHIRLDALVATFDQDFKKLKDVQSLDLKAKKSK